jgi:peptidoglycan/xylan/chitin deacetylase (PgdA/CDA1 family)
VTRVPILMYHYLGEPDDPADQPYYVPAPRFEAQIEWLRARRFYTVSLAEVVAHLEGRTPLAGRPVCITFDDGSSTFADIGVPILSKAAFTATMFVILGRVGDKGRLDEATMRSLAKEGFHFESHTVSHGSLTEMKLEHVRSELTESRLGLESLLSRKVRFLAYPFGHFTGVVRSAVIEAGYEAAVSTRYGYNLHEPDLFGLERIPVRGSDDLLHLRAKVNGLAPYKRSGRLLARWLT